MNDRGFKHRPEHNNWDAGGYCNALVVNDYGDGDTCGYRAPTVEPPPAAPRIFGGILPYEAEVAEPDGPRVVAWVLADYADRADAIFQKWLAKHDAQVVAQAKAEGEPLPVVSHKGPHDTDVSIFRTMAEKLRRDEPVGGSNASDALARLIDREVARADQVEAGR